MRHQKKGSKTRRIKWFPFLMGVLLLLGIYILVSQYLEYHRVQEEIQKNQIKLEEQKKLNEQLKDERSKAENPEEVERKARENLGLVKPGEIPVRTISTPAAQN